MPGSLPEAPDQPRPEIRVFHYDQEHVDEDVVPSAGAVRAPRAGEKRWVDVDGAGHTDTVRALGVMFDLHALALEDVMHLGQRPKSERYGGTIYVVLLVPTARGFEQVSLFLGHDFVITLQERPGDVFEPVRQRLRGGMGRLRKSGSDYLAYAIIDAVVDSYFPWLDRLSQRLDILEAEIFEGRSPPVRKIYEVRQELTSVMRALVPLREALHGLLNADDSLITRSTRVFLRDCQDHLSQLLDLVDTYREYTGSLLDAHLSISSHRMNEVMKVLTIIATIFIPLSFIASVYGMNFAPEVSELNMPELRWHWGYPFALGLMLLTLLGQLLFFYRRGWIFTRLSARRRKEESSRKEPG